MQAKISRRGTLRGILSSGVICAVVGCGGGGDGAEQAVDTPTAPAANTKALTVVAKPDNSYGVVTGRNGSTIESFRDASGQLTQSLYVNATKGEKVRVFNDADGLPERIVDETTGNALTITRTSPERIDYRAYDAAGTYLGGYAVLVKPDGLYAAPVLGTPSFAGQLSAQMRGVAQTGSFALLPAADAGLGPAVKVDAAALDFAEVATARALAANGNRSPRATLGIDGRAVVGGLAAGALLASGGWVPALIGGGMMAFGLQNYFLPVFDGVRDAQSLEQMSERLNTFLDRFDQGASASSALDDAISGAVTTRVSGVLQRAFDAAKDVANNLVDQASLMALTARSPALDTSVDGSGVDQSGTNYTLTGVVSATGALTAMATPDVGGASVTIAGNIAGNDLNGTISGRLGNGTVSGSVNALGQCAALQQSGAQGTFSYAFDAGASSGTIEFYRDAYSIPDGFRVVSAGQSLYDTGGLVSGSETRNLTLVGSRVLFVNVNAPRSSTQWELRVGCPV